MRTCPTCHRRYIDSQAACPLDQAALGEPDGEKTPGALGKVLGSFRLIAVLGTGGMGSLYVGAHTRLNRYVAIKLLRRELHKRTENLSRFFDEARTLSRIQHPNIVESIDLVEDVIDGAYCVMELLIGPDLKARIAEGPLPLPSVLDIGAQLADALAAAHTLDIVHRDLKPDNVILIRRDERADFVKLIDFGVAQIRPEGATEAPVGTPAYMAPEQAAGPRVDGRADIYALGVMLYEMTVGTHPFTSNSDTEYLLRHADEEPAPPSLQRAMPHTLEHVILRCLAKRPEERFPTAEAVASALRAIELEPARRRSTGKARWAAAAVLALGGIATAVVIVPRYLRASEAEATTTAPRPVSATAPASLPLPPPPPTQPTLVTIEVVSTPAGATVTRVGETAPLGVTPFTTSLVRADRTSFLRFDLAGHAPEEIAVPLQSSSTVRVELTRARGSSEIRPASVQAASKRPPTGSRPAPRPTQVQREGVMDPFAK